MFLMPLTELLLFFCLNYFVLFFFLFCGDCGLFFPSVTGFHLWGAVMAMGLVCTLYTALVSPETAPLLPSSSRQLVQSNLHKHDAFLYSEF